MCCGRRCGRSLASCRPARIRDPSSAGVRQSLPSVGGYPPALLEIPLEAQEQLVGRGRLEDRVGDLAGLLADPRGVGLDEAVLVVVLGEAGLGVEALADA